VAHELDGMIRTWLRNLATDFGQKIEKKIDHQEYDLITNNPCECRLLLGKFWGMLAGRSPP
jgi:hypothetical protein